MEVSPTRGPAIRDLGLALPPERMPIVRGGRPLKHWRYVGVYGPQLMLCAAEVFVGPLASRYWGVATPDGELLAGRSRVGAGGVTVADSAVRVEARARSTGDGRARPHVSIDLALDASATPPDVESVAGGRRRAYQWTRKRVGVGARGSVTIAGACHELEGEAAIDDSAGYHPRHTLWCWSAGVGRTTGGERVGWNLVEGINDAPRGSERTVWLDGHPGEVGPVRFDSELRRIRFDDGGELHFTPWATMAHRTSLGLLRSDLRQPFGAFAGELPGRVELREGFGVTERHEAWW